MAQVLDRVKTFFIMMTKNSDIEILSDSNIQKAVEAIRAQESGNIERMEKDVKDVNIPLEDGPVVKKVAVNEKMAQEELMKKTRTSKQKDMQREN
ncbi:MAG: hypothetical protein J6A04_02135 [Clostridia bacterium]|nr:hypothetical protein [Clostridia bacterium]